MACAHKKVMADLFEELLNTVYHGGKDETLLKKSKEIAKITSRIAIYFMTWNGKIKRKQLE